MIEKTLESLVQALNNHAESNRILAEAMGASGSSAVQNDTASDAADKKAAAEKKAAADKKAAAEKKAAADKKAAAEEEQESEAGVTLKDVTDKAYEYMPKDLAKEDRAQRGKPVKKFLDEKGAARVSDLKEQDWPEAIDLFNSLIAGLSQDQDESEEDDLL